MVHIDADLQIKTLASILISQIDFDALKIDYSQLQDFDNETISKVKSQINHDLEVFQEKMSCRIDPDSELVKLVKLLKCD